MSTSRTSEEALQAGITPSNPVQRNNGKTGYVDRWLGWRDRLLDGLSGIKAEDVLNVERPGFTPYAVMDPAAELKRALDEIKIVAFEEGGAQVDYAALRDSASYQDYRRMCSPHLANFDPAGLENRRERIAFWINLYNALVMDAVIALGIRRSVSEGKLGLLTFFRRAAYNVGGQRISLDEIENGVLRGNAGNPFILGPQFASQDPRFCWVIWPVEPRIHFALNCASRSCPPIQVYSADRLEEQLELAARAFVNANVKLDPAVRSLTLSRIFQWYKGDFGGRAGLVSFLIEHLPSGERRDWLKKNREEFRLRYSPYDWGLNTIQPI